jgi:DNA topoisomerase-1
MDTIQNRGYVWKKGTALVPSWTAFAVVGLLEQHFAKLVDYGFTAGMEEDLDSIARGDAEPLPWLTRFYFGKQGAGGGANGKSGGAEGDGLKQMVAERLGDIDARAVNSIPIGGQASGIVVRVGRYGPYLQEGEGDRRASLPDELAPDELTLERARELLEAPSAERADRELGIDPASGLPVLVRAGRWGPYVQLGRAEELSTKPKTSSLLSGMTPDELALADALQLLTLPRNLGRAPGSTEEIVADNGRYGPYVRKGTDYRSLQGESQLFTVTLDEAVELLSKPRERRTGQAAPPLAELGADPVSGGTVVVKEGRFGLYVTDGTVNASLRRGDAIETLTLERAAELLVDRRARAEAEAAGGGAPRRRGRATGRPAASSAAARGAAKARGSVKAAKATKATPKATKATAKASKAPAKVTKAAAKATKAPAQAVKATTRVAKAAPRSAGST